MRKHIGGVLILIVVWVCIYLVLDIALPFDPVSSVLCYILPTIIDVIAIVLTYAHHKKWFSSQNTSPNRLAGQEVNINYESTPSTQISLTEIDSMDGLEFEHFCASLLMKNNFKNLIITPASGDFGVDIVAEKDSIRYAIQCKCYSSKLGNSPIQEVVAGKAMYNCHVAVVMTNNDFTESAYTLAAANNVLLWNRIKLADMIQNN